MKKLFCLVAFFLYFFPLQTAHAATNHFTTNTVVTYTVSASGSTHVQYAIQLNNTTDKYYASSYTLHLGLKDAQNMQAEDALGAITPHTALTSTGDVVTLPLNKLAIGKGAIVRFTFSFDTQEVASLQGSMWEVNIPGLRSENDFTTFTAHVVVPDYFGKPIYVKPADPDGLLTFSKDQLGTSGISIAYGDKQVYAFHLTYNLQNTQLFPMQTEIALPPETGYQHIEIDSITPRPQNVVMDADGNWLAQYQLLPSEKVKVIVTGKAFISLTPVKEQLTKNEFLLFTKPTQYWQSTNPSLQNLAEKLKTPEAIYNYVVKTLHYNFARVSNSQERLGALAVLGQPNDAVCLEFTDLFIALARAAGIPARELDGYAYTQNTNLRPLSLQKEILHAWPEFYDSTAHAWIMVDPTWQNTTGGVDYFHTFDFDHVALVVKGASSTYPIPAGGYKLPGQEEEKDVVVTFAPESVAPEPFVNFSLHMSSQALAGFPIQGTVTMQNTSHVLFPAQVLHATTSLHAVSDVVTSPIPPYGTLSVPVDFGSTNLLTNSKDTITIRFGEKTFTKAVSISPISTAIVIFVGGCIIAILSFFISIIARKPRHL